MPVRSALIAILCTLAALEFALRGPARALSGAGGGDWAAPYAASRAWVSGSDPYDQAHLAAILRDAGRETDAAGRVLFTRSVYPPATLAVLWPLAQPAWTTARAGWTLVLLAATAALVWCAVALAAADGASRAALVAAQLALAPLPTGISRGQPAVLSTALILCGIVCTHRGREVGAGISLGLATVLKPQLGAPFVLYMVLNRGWRGATWSTAVVAAAALLGAGWLAVHDVQWWAGWRHNIAVETAGGEMDPAGPLAAQMINLRPLLAALGIGEPAIASVVCSAALGVPLALLARRRSDVLAVASAVAVWTLLTGYHRFYDAALLALPIAWATRAVVRRGGTRRPVIVLALASPFLIPGAWMLQLGVDRGMVPVAVSSSFLFHAVLLRHQTWALIGMLVILLVELRGMAMRPATADI